MMREEILIRSERERVVTRMYQFVHGTEAGFQYLPGVLKRALEYEVWKEREISGLTMNGARKRVSYSCFQAFAEAKPPGGLGATLDLLHRIVRGTPGEDLLTQLLKKPTGGQPGNQNAATEERETTSKKTNVDNIHVRSEVRPTGTSSSAALRRLRKSRPDLHKKVLEGELSANAAAVKAGFRPKTITVRVDTAENALKPLIELFGKAKLRAVLDA
ncbi:MAG: hypothetical protein WA817_16485 [Candidatus Acidiferrum sp.]